MLLLRSVFSARALLLLIMSLAGSLTTATWAQEQTTQDQVIDGVKVPKGVTRESVELNKKFAQAMIRNYKRYLELNETVKQKKQKGEALTNEETEIDAIKTYKQLQDWVTTQKEKEGYHVTVAAHTDAFGNVTMLTPPPETPDEEFEAEVTLKVHEPSHVEGNKKRAQQAGLPWGDVERLGEIYKRLRNRQFPTDEEYDFGAARKDKVKKYKELCIDPVESALEEIGEYEAEVKIYDKVLATLR